MVKNLTSRSSLVKSINTAIRLIAGHPSLAGSVALGEAPVEGREDHPRIQSRLARWFAILALAIALAPGAASAQSDGTVTISGFFSMDYFNGELDLSYVAPDLLAVYANGYEHTWMLTLYGTTQQHHTNGAYYGTEIHATSFDLEFFGPDAATLNAFVTEHLAGGAVSVYLQNTYYDYGGGFAIMHVRVSGGDLGMYFYTGQEMGAITLFPADSQGYPVVAPEPFSIEPDLTELGYSDMLSGTGGAIGSLAGPVTFGGSVGGPDPVEPVVLAVADASAVEGDRGTTNATVAVTLSSGSSQAISVSYRTVDGTAKAKSDYTATSGTLTFQPGVTRRTISVSIKADRKREATEAFTVQLSNAVGGTIDDGVATITILDND
jgi:hypothetical protein